MLGIFISSFDFKKVRGIFSQSKYAETQKWWHKGTPSVQSHVLGRMVVHSGSGLQWLSSNLDSVTCQPKDLDRRLVVLVTSPLQVSSLSYKVDMVITTLQNRYED